MHVHGECHCGQIKFEAEIDESAVRICHCTDCQNLTGSAYRVNVATRKGSFRLLAGKPKAYVKTAESGTKRAHGFCPECGTPIYSTADVPNPESYGLRVGTLRERASLKPARQGWCRSALPWVMNIESVPQSAKQPG
jgi:hypothetical protein